MGGRGYEVKASLDYSMRGGGEREGGREGIDRDTERQEERQRQTDRIVKSGKEADSRSS